MRDGADTEDPLDSEDPRDFLSYEAARFDAVCGACATVARELAAIRQRWVVVGGLVPSLLVGQTGAVPREEHVGARDLDVALRVGAGEAELVTSLARCQDEAGPLLDFLVPDGKAERERPYFRDLGGSVQAMVVGGLELAFVDRVRVESPRVGGARRSIGGSFWVCGPGAFVVLKTIAFDGRSEGKDAYDISYVLENLPAGPERVARHMTRLGDAPGVRRSLSILERDFIDPDGEGSERLDEFLEPVGARRAARTMTGLAKELLARCTELAVGMAG